MTTQRGQDITRDRLKFDERKYEEVDKAYRQKQIDKLAQDMQLNPRRVAAYERSISQRSGRAASRYEILQAMLRGGDITPDEYKNAMLNNRDDGGLDFLSGVGAPTGGSADAAAEAAAYMESWQ